MDPEDRSLEAAARAARRRDEYVEAHLDLVAAIARQLKHQHSLPPNIDVEDLRGAGYIGLIQAASRYTRALNTPFRTYATYRIRGEMMELVRRKQLRESSGEPLPAVDPAAKETPIAAIEDRQRVASLLSRLPPREREALEAYYLHGDATLGVVGKQLGVSASQSGRIIRTALRRANRIAGPGKRAA